MANSTSNSRNLSSLVHELRERIAATSSTPPNNIDSNADDDALETRFRAVLPNLLHAYVVPSSSANEREVIAVLKLISHTAGNFPGVFLSWQSQCCAARDCSRHGVIFETVGPLLSMLRTGSRDAYRMLFIDAMCAIEDILYISSFSSENSRITEATRFTLKCLLRSFSQNLSDSTCLCVLPTSNKPLDGPGILINLLGRNWWQPFATWIIKFLSKCLTEGTLYVEGLMNTSFVSAACSLLCYGDADLQMACFDFARVIGSVMSYDNVPHENLIRSISTILGEDKEGLPVFRNTSYDTCLGGCLRAVHSSCPDDVVKLTAENLVNVFHRSMRRTKSMELKVALCTAYIRISRTCDVITPALDPEVMPQGPITRSRAKQFREVLITKYLEAFDSFDNLTPSYVKLYNVLIVKE